MIVYLITNKINGKGYIGITRRSLKKRWKDHRTDASMGKKTMLHMAIRKYGVENFEITQIASCISVENLIVSEVEIIKQNRTKHPGGYNMTVGGDGTPGLTHSKEVRLKISKAGKGRSMSKITKDKLRLAHLGKVLSLEHRAKLSIAKLGKSQGPRSSEWSRKISIAKIGHSVSKETRSKISLAKKGIKWTQLRREKHNGLILQRKLSKTRRMDTRANQIPAYPIRHRGRKEYL